MSSDEDLGVVSSAVRLVTCDLSSLSASCGCRTGPGSGSSSKRKVPSSLRTPAPFSDLSPATAKRVLLPPTPSVIDRLLAASRVALMEGRRAAKSTPKESLKRKRPSSLDNGTSPAVKRLRKSKGGSESDSSPSRNTSTEKKNSKPLHKKDKIKKEKWAGNYKKNRFSSRLCFQTASLRSGKKRDEMLSIKVGMKALSKGSKEKVKRKSNDKTDSNSNVCTENDSNDDTVDISTDSEVSRDPNDFPDNKDKEMEKKTRKKRKRDSMWVKKMKKQLKSKSESKEKSLPPPALEPFTEINIKKTSESLEELPILDKESDDSLNMDFTMGNSSLNMTAPDDVPMPMLEKEVEIIITPDKKSFDSPKSLIKEETIKNSISDQKEDLINVDNGNKKFDSNKVNADKQTKLSCVEKDLSTDVNTDRIKSPKDDLELDNEKKTKIISTLEKDSPEQKIGTESENQATKEISQIDSTPNDLSTVKMYSQPEPLQSISCNHIDQDPKSHSELDLPANTTSNELSSSTDVLTSNVISTKCHIQNEQPKTTLEKFSTNDLTCPPQHVAQDNLEIVDQGDSHEMKVTEEVIESSNTISEEEDLRVDSQDDSEAYKNPSENISDLRPYEHLKSDAHVTELSSSTTEPEQTIQDTVNSKSDEYVSLANNDRSMNINSNISECSNDNNYEDNHNQLLTEPVLEELPIAEDKFVSSAQNLEEEITKLEAVLSENSDNESKYSDSIKRKASVVETVDIKNTDEIPNKSLVVETETCANDKLNENKDHIVASKTESKEISLLDADSTSDVKPQSLDDSFSNFSLYLPEDLELESSPSEEEREEEERDEMDVLPDSTESEKSEEQAKELNQPYEETAPDLPQTEEVLPVQNKERPPSDSLLEEVKRNDIVCKTEVDASEVEVTEATIFKQEFPEPPIEEPTPLAGSTPRRLSLDSEIEQKPREVKKEILTVEQRQMKESVLQALGLKSLSTSPQAPSEEKPAKRDGYTGTLKAVIKLNRSGDKKKMVYKRSEDSLGELEYRICSEIPATDSVPITHLNDIAGIRKNASKIQHESDTTNYGTATSNGHSDDLDSSNLDESKNASGKDLIIPEKSSSFSIHPGRLCSDVCNYCFGKFGSLDTPCHVATLKPERQKKILENELHLTAESCLCDKCYRHVDKKANFPAKANAGGSTKPRVRPPASSQCCIRDCHEQATHTVKKKWLVKLKKSISNKLDIDIDRPGAMYFPLCTQHHYWVDYFTVCGICRKRLNRNHLFSLGSETDRLNLMLAEDGIPARLSDKLFLCKLCRYYSNLRLKYTDPGSIPASGQIFYRDYRRKILTSLNIPVSDSEDEPVLKDEKKKSGSKKSTESSVNNGASASSKSDESVMALSNLATLLDQPEQQATRIQVKFGNVNIGRLSNLNIGQGSSRDERLPYSDVGLKANLAFEGPSVPDGSWEKCVSTLQFDKRTKLLWQDLQKPYGSQSSFLRHLVMLEKYWRAGHLTLTPNADERAAKYLNGVKNRIKAFEGSPSSSGEKPPVSVPPPAAPVTPPTTTVSNSEKFPLLTNTGEIEVTPISIVQKKPPPLPTPTPSVPQVEKKPMTYLDRAKSLVRMVPSPLPPSHRQRFSMPMQRFQQVPMYVPTHNYPAPRPRPPPYQQRPPPLMKILNKGPMSVPYYQQQIQQFPQAPAGPPLKPILPKLPSALTVTHVSQGGGAAITLNRSGITIEKQTGATPITPTLPIEKPSISVFREPAPGPH